MSIKIEQLIWHHAPGNKAYTAEPFPNFKYVIVDDERGVDWSIGGDGWNPVGTVDEAKTAAQADFEDRMRAKCSAALQPDRAGSGDAVRVTDAMAEAGGREIAKALRYDWNGLRDAVPPQFPEWKVGGAENPSKAAMIDLAKSVLRSALTTDADRPDTGKEWNHAPLSIVRGSE